MATANQNERRVLTRSKSPPPEVLLRPRRQNPRRFQSHGQWL